MAFPLRHQRRRAAGNGLVDYLVLTCAIAALMFPILQSAVFGPMEEAVLSQRQTLVNFIGQSRKQRVPNEWFGGKEAKQQEKFTDQTLQGGDTINDPAAITDPQGLQAGDLKSPGNLKNPQKLDTGKIGRPDSIAPPGELSADRINEPGQLTVAQGGDGGGGGGSFGGGGGLNNDFFSGNAGKGGNSKIGDAVADTTNRDGSRGRRSGGGFDIEEVSGGGGGDAPAKVQKLDKGETAKGNQTVAGGVEAKKRGMAAEDAARGDIDNRQNKIDWSKVIRILIILLILFLILLIVLSNAKRVGGGK